MNWTEHRLEGGVVLYHWPTDKFKTVHLGVFLQAPLQAESVTETALVSQVLGRGCRGYPTLLELNRRLEELYGAELSTGVSKLGDTQAVRVSLEVVHDRFLPASGTLARACDLLRRVLLEPEGFASAVVAQERDNLARRIEGLVNDKILYATVRCIEEMFRGEPFALTALGRAADIDRLTCESARERYSWLIQHAAVAAFAVGGGAEVVEALGNALTLGKRAPVSTAAGATGRAPAAVNRVIERQAVNQGKLSLGYRTGVTLADELYPAMVFYNGVLGGFPHSKLFRNVREKASLAYYASSRYEALKGVVLVSSGIDPGRYSEALEIIQRQVADLAAGDYDDEELEFTRRGLANRLRASLDSPGTLIAAAAEEALSGGLVPVDVRLDRLQRLGRSDIAAAAARVQLDTVYFLTSEEGADADSGL